MAPRSKEKALVVDKNPFVGSLLKELLESQPFLSVHLCQNKDEVEKRMAESPFAMIFIDCDIGKKGAGLKLLKEICLKDPSLPVIMLVDEGRVDLAVQAMEYGAFDVLEKPLHGEKVVLVIDKAVDRGVFAPTNGRRYTETPVAENYHGLVARSKFMKRVFNLIDRIRESSVNILITGPSGSGKEMIAKAIHQTSVRASQKFVAINCSAIPDALLEGELFGYKKGAFTDARTDKIGLFQEADQGTIFLDEIGDMPLTIQPKILRAIQEREVRPLGAIDSIHVNVRIIAATNQNLQEKINKKLFRQDLFYRLNAMQIDLPPLKDRLEDIPLLIEHFFEKLRQKTPHKIKAVSQQALKKLVEYSWPGNIRELENVIERASLLARHHLIEVEDLLFTAEENGDLPLSDWASRKRPLTDIEKDYIMEVLESVGGNRSETAHILGIGRKTLYNKLAKYGTL